MSSRSAVSGSTPIAVATSAAVPAPWDIAVNSPRSMAASRAPDFLKPNAISFSRSTVIASMGSEPFVVIVEPQISQYLPRRYPLDPRSPALVDGVAREP